MDRLLALILACACLASCSSPPRAPATDAPREGPGTAAPAAPTPAEPGPDDVGNGADVAPDEPSATTTSPPVDEPAPAPAPEAPWVEAEGHLGEHTLAWRPVDRAEVPRNREFELDVRVTRDGEPADVQLQVTGWMPDHSHGLVQMPLVDPVGPGRQRVAGLLLHMRGHWQLRFTIIGDGILETVTFDLTL